MKLKHAALVLVDISGYTQFLRHHNLTLLHAEEIITQLLESVIDAAEYPLTLNKLEGDAAFMVADMGEESEHPKAAQDIFNQSLKFFTAFHQKVEELNYDTSFCSCEACSNIKQLKLKALLHHGEVVFKKFRQFEEVAGEDVILIHRLLKNRVEADEYLLLTRSFDALLEKSPDAEKETLIEKYEDGSEVEIDVYYPQISEVNAAPSILRQGKMLGLQFKRVAANAKKDYQPPNFNHLATQRVQTKTFIKEFFDLMKT